MEIQKQKSTITEIKNSIKRLKLNLNCQKKKEFENRSVEVMQSGKREKNDEKLKLPQKNVGNN